MLTREKGNNSYQPLDGRISQGKDESKRIGGLEVGIGKLLTHREFKEYILMSKIGFNDSSNLHDPLFK